jgi:HAD superfamily hydrolase (TIGR01484 family)
LQGDLIKDVIALCIKHFYFLNIYANDELHGFHVKGDYTFSQLYSNQTGAHYTQKIQHSANIPQDNINKLLIITAAQERDAIFDKVEPLYNSRANVFKSQPEYIEFTRQGVSKAHALGLWCDNKGIAPAEILAFGDAENDLEMLNFCGKGIIGTNATQGLKARFPNVSKWSNDQAMVAKELTAAMNW